MDFTEAEPEWFAGAPVAVKFFARFARMEYALKSAGYVMPKRRNAEPDWKTFSNALGRAFLEEMRLSSEAEELFARPPRKQVVREGRLSWDPEEPAYPCAPKSSVDLFESVRRVRNNLFHGGKVPFDRYRDETLINAAYATLKAALYAKGAEKVRDAFERPS